MLIRFQDLRNEVHTELILQIIYWQKPWLEKMCKLRIQEIFCLFGSLSVYLPVCCCCCCLFVCCCCCCCCLFVLFVCLFVSLLCVRQQQRLFLRVLLSTESRILLQLCQKRSRSDKRFRCPEIHRCAGETSGLMYVNVCFGHTHNFMHIFIYWMPH